MLRSSIHLLLWLTIASTGGKALAQEAVFDPKFPKLDSKAVGAWWKESAAFEKKTGVKLDVPRDQVAAFALYTVHAKTLKLTAQFFPLMPDEKREARLEIRSGQTWKTLATAEILYPGWSAHFRIENWDDSKDVVYRVRHGEAASFEGTIRKDPRDQDQILVGVLSCNSSRTKGPRARIVENLKHADPDLIFFAGDQTYRHTEHTAGWIEFGLQFREVLKDRPVITIPDDHDVGQNNLWGNSGTRASSMAAPDGGFYFPPSYVNMVQRQQTWHLPDPAMKEKVGEGYTNYFTRYLCGGIDFAIIEDRKFKTGPKGEIPKMGPRPDHINDPEFDRAAIDLPHLKLLGDRQLAFLKSWTEDWRDVSLKCALSQTAFCGAVHLHGKPDARLLADLDCNGWPQTGRNKALRILRQVRATHLCGDQHLAVVVQHGIENFRDGPFAFTSPAIVNTIYGRWWRPLDEKAGGGEKIDSTLPWTGDYFDGLGNRITMHAYANPENRRDQLKRADGFGLARFDKKARTVTFECWPRFASIAEGDAQFPGWPLTVSLNANDGRKPTHWLAPIETKLPDPIVQVIRERDLEVLYTRPLENGERLPVFEAGLYTVRLGSRRPDLVTISRLPAQK